MRPHGVVHTQWDNFVMSKTKCVKIFTTCDEVFAVEKGVVGKQRNQNIGVLFFQELCCIQIIYVLIRLYLNIYTCVFVCNIFIHSCL
jgi:hypothetical protein